MAKDKRESTEKRGDFRTQLLKNPKGFNRRKIMNKSIWIMGIFFVSVLLSGNQVLAAYEAGSQENTQKTFGKSMGVAVEVDSSAGSLVLKVDKKCDDDDAQFVKPKCTTIGEGENARCKCTCSQIIFSGPANTCFDNMKTNCENFLGEENCNCQMATGAGGGSCTVAGACP